MQRYVARNRRAPGGSGVYDVGQDRQVHREFFRGLQVRLSGLQLGELNIV